jgi:hypothetical protein
MDRLPPFRKAARSIAPAKHPRQADVRPRPGAAVPNTQEPEERRAMAIDFETVWDRIHRAAPPGSLVRHWSAAKGYTGGFFRVQQADRSSFTVSGGSMRAPRRVAKSEFARIVAVWEGYVAGSFPRSAMQPLSLNSTYILSLLHATLPSEA